MQKASELASINATRAVLDEFNLSTKKRFGQHFLIDDAIVAKIIEVSRVNKNDEVLEIGPGIGTLTVALSGHAKKVRSIEKDSDLFPVLNKTCSSCANLSLIFGDALEKNIIENVYENKLIANLPYSVAATIVLEYFQNASSICSMTVMVQQEVAQRMMAKRGTKNYGAYTLKLALYAKITDSFNVKPSCFMPVPNVNSTVVCIERYNVQDNSGVVLTTDDIALTSLLIDAAFANRRKTIMNSFKMYFVQMDSFESNIIKALKNIGSKDFQQIFTKANIDSNARGETLGPDDYICLMRVIQTIA